ncbi:MAG: SUMF1/EgtB/PvdO family nonheme iron enzyme, partial [Myxococcota bacterium]
RATVALLERALAGDYTEGDVAAVYDDQLFRVPLLGELDRTARGYHASWPAERLAAVRATLAVLPGLLDRLRAITAGHPLASAEVGAALAGLVAQVHADAGAERDAQQSWQVGQPRCPRCGSVRVVTQHTSAFGPRRSETRCQACHHSADWSEDDVSGAERSHPWGGAELRPGAANADDSGDAPGPQQGAPDAWPTAAPGLAEAYIAYLDESGSGRHGGRAAALVDELSAAGLSMRAALLRSYLDGDPMPVELGAEQGPWAGRRVFIGESLPAGVGEGEGDLWFDTCELSAMILVPHEGYSVRYPKPPPAPVHTYPNWPFLCWLSVAPVARWQFAAFTQLAMTEWRPVEIRPPFDMLSPMRIARAPELAAVGGISYGEAYLYAIWLAKNLPTLYDWQAAADALPEAALDAMWRPAEREWVSDRCEDDPEGLRVATTAATYHLDPDEVYEEEQAGTATAGGAMVVGEWHLEPSLGLRTAVTAQLGLIDELGPDGARADHIGLLRGLPRSAR